MKTENRKYQEGYCKFQVELEKKGIEIIESYRLNQKGRKEKIWQRI